MPLGHHLSYSEGRAPDYARSLLRTLTCGVNIWHCQTVFSSQGICRLSW